MLYRWIVYDHHLAIEAEQEILHPSAEEIYSFLSDGNDSTDVPNPVEQLNEISFSRFGSPLKCELNSGEGNQIVISLYAVRKNQKVPVDMISGVIIDQVVFDNEWFYLNDDFEELQQILCNAEISKSGVISIGQYIDLLKQVVFSDHKEIINNVSNETVRESLTLIGDPPHEINANLYNYQKTGYLWLKQMLDISRGCILGDEMGLGKTLQIITLFQDLKNYGREPFLVIAPLSLLENWKRECNRFAPCLDVYIHHGTHRTGRALELKKHDVVVISYNTAVSDLSLLKMVHWWCVVLDEAQNIKNPYSDRSKSVKAITRKSGIAVTGTPFENHISDIWSLVDFAVPGLFGSLVSFQRNVTDDVLGAKMIEPILSSIMIRRLVKDVANDLPEKVIVPQPIIMTYEERTEYERLRQNIKESISGDTVLSFKLLQKLRMYCTHRALIYDNVSDPAYESVKYQRFCEIVEEIVAKNEKVIVFTSYIKMFDIFKADVHKRFGISMDSIYGETPVKERQIIVDRFNDFSGPAMLVLNPKAAGTGLNITGANHVIHYNLEWNPALEDQASARAYRRGQDKTVFIYRLFYADTVEQVINERIERKRIIAEHAVVGTDGIDERNDIIRALEMAPALQEKG